MQEISPSSQKYIPGLTLQCHFLFHNLNYSLLTCPVRQWLSWLAAASISRIWSINHSTRTRLPDIDEILLGKISFGRLIPALSQLDKPPALRTTVRPTLYRSLFVKTEEDPNTLTKHNHDISLNWA